MHEVALVAVPVLAAPVYWLRMWVMRRRARRAGAVKIGEPLGSWGPLQGADGGTWGPKGVSESSATVFVFMSNQCPGVKAYDERLNRLAAAYRKDGLRVIGINSVPTDLYPGESVAGMRTASIDRGLLFPYVKDPQQELKRRLGATVTPQAFVVDRNGRLRYRGRIDDAFIPSRVTTNDLEDAVRALLQGEAPMVNETHAIGCSMDEVPAASVGVASGPARRPLALEA